MEGKIGILIADDHPIVRQGLRQTIESDADLLVIAEASDGLEAIEKSREHQPDVLVLDIGIPKMDGFQVALSLREEKIRTEIVFLTVHREEGFMKKALKVGGRGYVLKDSSVIDIVCAIKAAHQGQPFISPAMMSYLIDPPTAHSKEGLEGLTPSERNVLKLIAQYKTTKEIAETLFVSTRTVETHRLNICQKLHLRGSHSLMKFALEHVTGIETD